MKPCGADADCREGFRCDPGWKVCSLPGFLAPKPPVCGAPPPPRRSFGPAVQLSTARSPGVAAVEPGAAIGADGSVTAVYITVPALGQKNALGAGTLADGGSVRGDRELQLGRENHYDPWMAADKKGKLHLVWLGFDGGRAPEKRMQIGYATSADGVTWSAPSPAFDAATDCPGEAPGCMDKPMVAIGPDKQDPKKEAVYVAYWSEVTEATKLVRSSDGGRTFSKSVTVGPGGYGDLEVGADGDVHAVYTRETGEEKPPPDKYGDVRRTVEYAVSRDGGRSFEKPRTVSAEGDSIPMFFSNPQVAADAKRKLVYVVYPRGTPDGRWEVVLATSKDGGASWSRVKVNDDQPCASHMKPTLALRPGTGELHVVWTEDRSGKGGLAYAVCAPGGATCSANEAVNDQPFASYGLGRHTAHWLGEYDAILVDEKRKRLHVVYTATVDESGAARSRIFVATRKL
jgi:hypothetical protein